jgi:N-acetylneuraminic acid mutarotase
MKKILLILLYGGYSFPAMAQTGPWTQKNDIGFTAPNGPVAGSATTGFGIGSAGFVAAQAVQASGDSLKNYFGQYDPATNTWTQKALYGGVRGGASFTIGGKGYMAGAAATGSLWAYDPATDTWAQLADYPAFGHQPGFGFSINNRGYIGSGLSQNIYLKDFWQYDPVADTWTRKADQPGMPRTEAIAFSIGNKGYWGTGVNFQNFNNPTSYNDFYEYDPTTDAWTQKANVGGSVRAAAVGFSIGNMGYVGTGTGQVDVSNGIPNYPFLKDFWQYDPSADTWTQKADYGGGPVEVAVGFTILDKGYIGSGDTGTCSHCGVKPSADFWQYDPATDHWQQIAGFAKTEPGAGIRFSLNGKGYLGVDGSSNDVWEYDTLTDVWSQKVAFPGPLRSGITGLTIGDKGYAGTGASQSLGYYNDFWQFDPVLNTWTAKANFGGGPRTAAMGFGIGSKGYMGTGTTDVNSRAAGKKDMWEYDPATDTWTPKTDFGGTPRSGSIAFTIGDIGYTAMGNDTTNATFGETHDLWRYDPATDTWVQKANFAGRNSPGAIGFGLVGKGYLGLGRADTTLQPRSDLWQYDTTADSWTRIADFPGGGRAGANSIAIGNKAYIGSGEGTTATILNDWWQFDPSGATPLPLTLTGFTAVYNDPVTVLNWQTEQEQNTGLFTIRRSTDARKFNAIGTVAAAGNSASPKQYSFTDESAGKTGAPTLYYRLQETDLDGKTIISPVAVVNIPVAGNRFILSPNPARDHIIVEIGVGAASKAVLFVSDLTGRKVLVRNIDLSTGNNSFSVRLGLLPAGVYYMAVESSAGSWQGKFVKE